MSGYDICMAYSPEERDRMKAVGKELDRSRAWVKVEVHLVTGLMGRPATMSEERVFLGEVPPPSVESAQAESAQQAIRGLRELALHLERQLAETYLP